MDKWFIVSEEETCGSVNLRSINYTNQNAVQFLVELCRENIRDKERLKIGSGLSVTYFY